MPTFPTQIIPNAPSSRLLTGADVSVVFDLVINGIVMPVNDTIRAKRSKKSPDLYVKKISGSSVVSSIGGSGTPNGLHVHVHVDPSVKNRSHKLFSVGNIIYLFRNGRTSVVRDISDDGFSINFMSAAQTKKNTWIAIGDETMNDKLYKYDGDDSSGAITVFSDAGGGFTTVTSIGHDLSDGDFVTQSGTTNYDGEFEVVNATTDTYDIEIDFVADDGTGDWVGPPKLGVPVTISDADTVKLVGVGNDRLAKTGVGVESSSPFFSNLSVTGDFSEFTPDATTVTGAGNMSGVLGEVTGIGKVLGYTALVERNQITFHKYKQPIEVGGILQKNEDTIIEALTLSGYGTASPRGFTTAKDLFFLADPNNGIIAYNVSTKQVTDLTKNFKDDIANADFTNSSVEYDRVQDLLIVTASSAKGIAENTLYIYSFQSGHWSIAEKDLRMLAWDEIEKKMYGTSSVGNELYEVFDGTNEEREKKIKMTVGTRYFEGMRRAVEKDYLESSVVVGFTQGSDSFKYKILVDEETSPRHDEVVSLEGLASDNNASIVGQYGRLLSGGGAISKNGNFTFMQKYDDDNSIVDFQRISIIIEEESNSEFLVFKPEILIQENFDLAEDI